jgi:hypothetical protein
MRIGDGVVNRAVESFCRDYPNECQSPEAIKGVRMTIRIAVTAFREGRAQAAKRCEGEHVWR